MHAALSALSATQPLEQRLEQIIEAATAELEAGRPIDLDAVIAAHPELAEQLRKLLPMVAALVGMGDALADPASALLSPNGHPADPPNRQLGDFRILRELGRGGMGTVFEAEQISMGRSVALKVLPFAALADGRSLQRFRNEVRAAAALDHPNVVSVYSVGEERGVHFYAMQLIRGQTLAELIAELHNDRNVSPRVPPALTAFDTSEHVKSLAVLSPSTKVDEQARLSTAPDSRKASGRHYRRAAQLAIQAAEALQHAHDQGVLHRDIKPGNLLLDAAGKLYVTDFGLARIEADVGMTMTGDIIGTLRYMAPEQALAKRMVIDHRADVYSLGATLYELLTLQPAFTETDRSQLLKQIAFEDPKPLRKLDCLLPSELETIVLKAMSKNPDDRYSTSQQLADDLSAFLDNRPIRAKPPTVMQRAAHWSRRHRGFVAALAVVVLVLTVGSLVSSVMLLSERRQTELAADESEAVTEFLINELLAAPQKADKFDRELTVHEVLANSESKVATAFVDRPLVEATVRDAMARTYVQIRKYDQAELHARRAYELRKGSLGPLHPKTLEATEVVLKALSRQEKHSESCRLSFETFEQFRCELGLKHVDTLSALHMFISTFYRSPREIWAGQIGWDELEQLSVLLMKTRQELLGREHRETLAAMNIVAAINSRRSRPERAEALSREALQIARRVLPHDDSLRVVLTRNVGSNHIAHKRYREALAIFQELLEANHKSEGIRDDGTIDLKVMTTWVQLELGEFEDAKSLCKDALNTTLAMYGSDHELTIHFKRKLSVAVAELGDTEESQRLQREVLDSLRRVFGSSHPDTIFALRYFARALAHQGRYEEARTLIDEAIHSMPAEDVSQRNYTAWLLATSPHKEIRDGNRALKLATEACELRDYEGASAVDTLAGAYAELGDFEAAIKWSKRSMELTDDPIRIEKFSERLASYQKDKAWRED